MKRNTYFKLLPALFFVWAESSGASLIKVDLQNIGAANQQTQAGWTPQELPTGPAGAGGFDLILTSDGTAAGISATLGGDSDGWEARGGSSQQRGQITGTSFNDLLEDLVATQDQDAFVSITGLTIGKDYLFQTWHNDSYLVNQGFGSGGGTVTPSVIGGIELSKSIGTITNLKGIQTDSAFGVTSILFTATSASATINLDGTNTNGFLPINGISFSESISAVPEPPIFLLFSIGVLGLITSLRSIDR
ncbi:PEP-CTERM protein-sorting domain-containing protein [Nitrosomonas aestuarii]|uniref:PEP-CTERM protein-sorting domain-containing protein n=1 Tax=Nitrosomonas aestuarii TaxID=52441 RepID=A0A1I4CQW5_9PROT|nr:hypothetical protein [Nitrosomonas aestuarii]SFK83652.1 PEP-CTERM protein-sorting domain-containing protein [Nitrosomonas aestuarii]